MQPEVCALAPLTDVLLIRAPVHADARGWLLEPFRRSWFASLELPEFVHQVHSFTAHRGTLRGLHFQRPPAAQGKLVRCALGAVFDAIVDLRRDSRTFGCWTATILARPS